MKTRIRHLRGRIQLVIDEGARKGDVLASMDHWEGTLCWDLQDLRYSVHRTPNRYGDCAAHHICASYRLAPGQALEDVTKHLARWYFNEATREVTWNPMNGQIKGQPEIKGSNPGFRGRAAAEGGYFSRADGLAWLKEAQAYWATQPEWSETCRIPNPHAQISETGLFFKVSHPELAD